MYWHDISLILGNYIWGFFGWKFFSTILWIRNKGLSGLVTISRPEQCIVCSETSNPYAICKASMVFVGRAAFAGKLPSCPSPASLCVLQFRPPRNNQSTSVIYTQYTYSFMYFTYIQSNRTLVMPYLFNFYIYLLVINLLLKNFYSLLDTVNGLLLLN